MSQAAGATSATARDTDGVDKQETRRVVRARRGARGAGELAAAGAALAAHAPSLGAALPAPAATIAAFVGVRGEPPTLPLLDALRASGATILLPILRADMDLEWAQYAGAEALVDGRLGMREPAGPSLGRSAVAAADLVLTPALAVDDHGRRLGQGGGSYDRSLPRATGRVVAIVFDEEVLDEIPTEPHDRPVDGRLTPVGGLVWTASGIDPWTTAFSS
jgi:5-formyltetrahydrofolate cyclo-ligase